MSISLTKSPAPLAAISSTSSPPAFFLAYTPIHLMQSSGIEPMTVIYGTPTTFGIPARYILGTRLTSTVYMQPFGITSIVDYLRPLRVEYIPAPYATFAPNTTFADYIQPSIRLAYPTVYHLLSASHLLTPMITTSIRHSKKLSNLTKIYTDNAKYIGRNNSFIFKLAIFHDIFSKADVMLEAKMKVFSTMLKDLLLDYYYLNISINAIAINFD